MGNGVCKDRRVHRERATRDVRSLQHTLTKQRCLSTSTASPATSFDRYVVSVNLFTFVDLLNIINTLFLHNCMIQTLSILSSRLKATLLGPNELKRKRPSNELVFGKHFTDYMLHIKWTANNGWEDPKIGPVTPFQMHPASKVIHYQIILKSIPV